MCTRTISTEPLLLPQTVSFLVLQSSWRGRVSWLLCFNCLPDVLWLLVFCDSSSQWCRLVCSVWLWYFLMIFACFLLFTFYKVQPDTHNALKPVLSRHSKRRPKIGFQNRLSLNAGHKYCRMLSWSILQYFWASLNYHLPFKTFILSIFEWPLKTGYLYSS